jgi:hypothetical protein
MTERTFTLSEITQAADAPLAKARQQASVDRALDLFAQGLIDALKAIGDERDLAAALDEAYSVDIPDEPDDYTDDPAPSIYHGNPPPRLPQPDPDGGE